MTTVFSIFFAIAFVALLVLSLKVMLQRDAARAEVARLKYRLGIDQTIIADQDSKLLALSGRVGAAEADADKLAVIVSEYLQIIDAGGENPAMKPDRDAMAFHQQQLKLRPPSSYGHTEPIDQKNQ